MRILFTTLFLIVSLVGFSGPLYVQETADSVTLTDDPGLFSNSSKFQYLFTSASWADPAPVNMVYQDRKPENDSQEGQSISNAQNHNPGAQSKVLCYISSKEGAQTYHHSKSCAGKKYVAKNIYSKDEISGFTHCNNCWKKAPFLFKSEK